MYIGDLLRNWKHKAGAVITLERSDQVIIRNSEDKIQKSVYILNQISKDYNLKIPMEKTKIMAFKGKHLVHQGCI